MTDLPANLQVNNILGVGNALFTSTAIDPGAEIFHVDRPLVSVLNQGHLKTACSNCFVWLPENGTDGGAIVQKSVGGRGKQQVKKLRACQGCKIVRYCSTERLQECQAQSWKAHHKRECKIFDKLYPKVLPNTVRIVMQLLLRRKAQDIPDAEWQNFLNLQSHLDDYRSASPKNDDGLTTYETIELMSRAVSTYSSSKEPLGFIQSVTSRVLINSLTLTTPTFDPLGLCVCTQAALLNHSCTPNTAITFSGPILSARSLGPIPPNTELTISYVDTTVNTTSRKSELRSRYFFTCACPACGNGLTNGLPDPGPDPTFDALSVRAIELQSKAASQQPEKAASLLNEALALLKAYPAHRQPHSAILHSAFLNALALQAWPPALTCATTAYFSIDPLHYQPDWHPVRVVRKWVLLRLVVQVAQLVSENGPSVRSLAGVDIDWQIVVRELLRQVEEGVARSHGVGSKFEQEVNVLGEGLRLPMGHGRLVNEEVVVRNIDELRHLASLEPE